MMETAKKSRSKQPTYTPQHDLSAFGEFREKEETFDAFVKYFLRKTYSEKLNSTTIDNHTRLSKIITVSDEAFVYLVLENNWERWLDINQKSQNRYIPSRRGSSVRITSDILPQYTNINGHPSNDGTNVVRGWSDDGIERFNELCQIIKNDRKTNSKIEDKIFQTIRSDMNATTKSKKRRIQYTSRLKAYVDNDDSDSSDDNSEVSEDE